MNRTAEVGAVGQQLVRITQVLDRPPWQAPNNLRPKPDECIRPHLTVGAGFGNDGVMGNVVDDAVYALDESVRSVRNLIENVRDDAPVDFGGGVRRHDSELQSRIGEEGRVLCEHLLAVLRSLEAAKRTVKISPHGPSQRATPFCQADFGKVIQSTHEVLFARAGKFTESGAVRSAGDFEGGCCACLRGPRSAQNAVERGETCLRHFTPFGFLHVEAGAIPELQCACAFGVAPNAVLNVLSGETERLAVRHPTKDDMDMRMFRVPVNDRRPL